MNIYSFVICAINLSLKSYLCLSIDQSPDVSLIFTFFPVAGFSSHTNLAPRQKEEEGSTRKGCKAFTQARKKKRQSKDTWTENRTHKVSLTDRRCIAVAAAAAIAKKGGCERTTESVVAVHKLKLLGTRIAAVLVVTGARLILSTSC